METLYFNGKFTAQATTGVQRVGRCMLLALDRRLANEVLLAGRRWVLLCPPGGLPPPLKHIEIRFVGSAFTGLRVWEQWTLPREARDGLLVNLSGAAPAFAARQICTLHDAAIFDRPDAYSWLFLAWYRWLFKRLARTAISIVTVSEFSKGRLVECLGIGAERIQVIHLGGDHLAKTTASTSLPKSHRLDGVRFVLAVGSDNANKNLAATIEAFSRFCDEADDQELHLVVVGESNDAVFSSGARSATPSARVVRLRHVDDEELKALYQAAECLVFVSLYEGFGLPPLEAMSCDCPVLASKVAAMPEVCGDAVLYADPHSPSDITQRLRSVMTDADLRTRLIGRGRERVAMFTWDAAAAVLRLQLEIQVSCPGLLPT